MLGGQCIEDKPETPSSQGQDKGPKLQMYIAHDKYYKERHIKDLT